MLKFASDKEQMKKYVMANKERFSNLDEETYTAILILLDERRYLEKMKEKLKPEEGGKYDMCLAFEQMIEEGKKEGKKEGIELSNIDKIRKKIQKGYDSDIIADHLELDIEYVEKIIQLIQKSPQETNNQITKRILVNSY